MNPATAMSTPAVKPVRVSLPATLHEAASRAADARGTTLPELLARLLQQHLRRTRLPPPQGAAAPVAESDWRHELL